MGRNFITYEIKRIFKSRFTQIIILISAVFPLLGSFFSKYISQEFSYIILGINSSTALSEVILVPTKIGAILSSITFTMLTVFEFNRMSKFRTDQIIEPISSHVKINMAKILGLICCGLASTLISMTIMVPHYIYNVGSLKSFYYYVLSYVVIMGGAIIFSIMMSAGFYLVFKHVNITFIIMFLAIMFSSIAGIINYQYMWVQTGAGGFSEYFGDGSTILGMLWNRLFAFLISLGILLTGLLCNRCYSKGMFGSCFKNCRKYKFLPIFIIVSFIGAFFTFQNEPIFKSMSIEDMAFILLNQKEPLLNDNIIGVSDMVVDLEIDKNKKYASGFYKQTICNLSDVPQILYFEIAEGYSVNEVKLADKSVDATQVSSQTLSQAKYKNIFQVTIPENYNSDISLRYSGTPKFISADKNFSMGISKDYIELTNVSIAPSLFSTQENNKIRGTIKVDSDFVVIAKGEKNNKLNEDRGFATWSFSCNTPKEVSLVAGRYEIFERNVDGTNVEFFYPELATEELKGRGTDILDIFSYFSEKFGPLNKDSFKLIVTSGVHGGGGVASGNISYISEDCLIKRPNSDASQASETDTFALLTHEIAHEWWGIGIDISNENSDICGFTIEVLQYGIFGTKKF